VTDSAQPRYFNIADPSFVIDSEEVLAAREESWYVRTNYGLAVLRYDEVSTLLKARPPRRDRSVRGLVVAGAAQPGG
jgi:hypothetical protein